MLSLVNLGLGLGTLALLAALLGYGGLAAGRHLNRAAEQVGARRALLAVLALSLGATVVSLYYSDVAGFPPCTLCWYQRIAMYPIALVSAVAIFRRDERHALPYLASLAWVGLAFGLFHVNLQAGLVSTAAGATCGVGEAACDVPPFVTLGFVTIPIASAAGFAAILAALDLAGRALRRSEHHAVSGR